MAFPALHPVEYFLASFHSVCRDFGFRRNLNWFSGFLILKARGEMLHVRHQVRTLLVGKRVPRRHVGSDQSTTNRVKQVFVGGERPGWGGAALKHTQCEITRLGIEPGEVLSVSIPQFAVTTDTVSAVVGLRAGGVTAKLADVALHLHPLVFLVSGVLCQGDSGNC